MSAVTVKYQDEEVTLLRLARELALDIHPIETILEQLGVSGTQFAAIKQNPRFQALHAQAVAEWESAINTNERVKLKAAALMEYWLPELHARLWDNKENLAAKIEGAKLVAKLADLGVTRAEQSGPVGDKFVVQINLGSSEPLKFEKDLPAKVIDVSPENI